MAKWLDKTFYTFDKAILSFWHKLAVNGGGFLTPFMKFITFFGNAGLFMILLGLVLFLFKNTRKHGTTALIAILIGAILTNLILKPIVARARPYTREEFRVWWNLVGSIKESDFSFPSGHATVATDCLLAIFLISKKKKISWLLIVFALFICASRNYLMVHYPTDVIVGILVGSISAVSSYFIVNFLYKKMEKNKEKKFCAFYLDFCLIELIKSKRKNCQVDGVDAKIENEFNQDDKK